MGSVFFWIVVAIGIFLLAREFMCWYWKINKMIEEMEKINKLLTSIYYSQSDNKKSAGISQSVSNNQNAYTMDSKKNWSNDIPEL